jgi:hypothetical protein
MSQNSGGDQGRYYSDKLQQIPKIFRCQNHKDAKPSSYSSDDVVEFFQALYIEGRNGSNVLEGCFEVLSTSLNTPSVFLF